MVTQINHAHLQDTAARMIERWGQDGVLRRASGDRPCLVAFASYSPMERMGALFNPLDRKALVSAKGLDVPPDQEQDRLVVNNETLRIVQPPKKNGTAETAVYWTLAVRR